MTIKIIGKADGMYNAIMDVVAPGIVFTETGLRDDSGMVNPIVVTDFTAGPPDSQTSSTTGAEWTWDIDFTVEQELEWDTIVTRLNMSMTGTQYSAVKDQAARLRAYYQNEAPTNTESVEAIKDIIKILKVMWNDGT